MHNRASYGPRRYLPYNSAATLRGNSTAQAFVVTKGGLYLRSALTNPIIPVADGLVARLWPFGTGGDDKEFLYRIWMVHTLMKDDGSPTPYVILEAYASGQATLTDLSAGLAAASADNPMDTTDLFAKTLTATLATDATTPGGPATLLQTGLNEGTIQASSGLQGEAPASLLISSFGRADGLYAEFDINSGGGGGGAVSTSANMLVLVKGA